MTGIFHHSSARARCIEPFHAMELLKRAKALEAEGRDIIHLEVGEPDFPTPDPILSAATKSLGAGRVFYTPALGLLELRQSIAAYYISRHDLSIPASRIVVTTGASGALTLALACLCEPGRKWLLPEPGYPCNRHFIRCFEGVPVAVPVGPESNFQPTRELLGEHWDGTTDGLLVASPANPTGTILAANELESLAAYTRSRSGHLIVDEIYHGLTYDCDAPTALGAGDDIWVVQSFSKYFQMTGWRLGWLVVPEPYVRDVEKLAQNLFISPPTPAQWAALAAFRPETLAILEERRAEFHRRRDYLAPALESLGFRIAARPQGAFYLYCDCSALTDDSFGLASRMLEEAGVAATPGLDFEQAHPERHIRFAYTTGVPRLEEAVERLRRLLGR